jgi:peptide/nickel transport system ATP-binding protein
MVLRDLAPSAAREEAMRVLDEVRLPAVSLQRYPGELSGGERQRVAIARALVADPEVLICDEITSALDVSVQAAVLDLLGTLQATRGLSLVFITHDLGVVASIADRMLVLNRGVICETGEVATLIAHPTDAYTRRLLDAAPTVEFASAGGTPAN